MGDNFVSNSQAGSANGADNPSGAQGDNTFQVNNRKQLVYLVRYKPAPVGPGIPTDAAAGMLSGVTGAIDGAVNAVESAMASIPGLDMFIKEEKPQESDSDKGYTFFKDYSGWDSVFQTANDDLKEMNPDNLTDVFEFSSTDADGRKNDAQTLLDKVKSKMSGWSQYSAYVHFVGIGMGGSVINECTGLMASDSQFQSEKWLVKSVIYVGSPVFKNQHLLNKAAMKGKGEVIAFGNPYDLTHNAIYCFENSDKLIQLIKDSNKNLLSLMVGKIKLRVIDVLSILLSGLHLSAGDTSELNKFKKIKDGIEGLVSDVIDLVKKVIAEGGGFVKLGDLPQFSHLMDGFSSIPGECAKRCEQFFEDFATNIKNQVKNVLGTGNLGLGPKDLVGFLNCLCPLFDAMSHALSIFKYDSPNGLDLANQIIESAGVTKIYAPVAGSQVLDVDTDYDAKFAAVNDSDDDTPKDDAATTDAATPADETTQPKPNKAAAFVSNVQSLIAKAADKTTDVSAMDDNAKLALAEAINCMVQPMLVTKHKIWKRLIDLIPLDPNKFLKEYTANKLMAIPGGLLTKLDLKYPADLQKSIDAVDAEMTRIKSYFAKNEFDLAADSMHFIFNEHNLTLKKMYGPVANALDKATGYLAYKKAKGFTNEVTLDDNTYIQGTSEEKDNVAPAQELPKAKAA